MPFDTPPYLSSDGGHFVSGFDFGHDSSVAGQARFKMQARIVIQGVHQRCASWTLGQNLTRIMELLGWSLLGACLESTPCHAANKTGGGAAARHSTVDKQKVAVHMLMQSRDAEMNHDGIIFW